MDIAQKIGLGVTLSIALIGIIFALYLIFYETPRELSEDYSSIGVVYLTKSNEEKDSALALSFYEQGLQASRHALAHNPYDHILWSRHLSYLKMTERQDAEAHHVLKILHRLHPHKEQVE